MLTKLHDLDMRCQNEKAADQCQVQIEQITAITDRGDFTLEEQFGAMQHIAYLQNIKVICLTSVTAERCN
jgi:hypothetical protein